MPTSTRLLFVSDADTCRGRLAEACLRARGGPRLEVFAAGVSAGEANPLTVRVLDEIDVPMFARLPRDLSTLPAGDFDLIVTLSDGARDACLDSTKLSHDLRKRLLGGVPDFLHWSIDDPSRPAASPEAAIEAVRRARDELCLRIDTLVNDGFLDVFRRQRDRLQHFADLLDEGILIHDELRNIHLVNRAFLRITGRRREDLVGLDCHTVFEPHGLCGGDCQFCSGDDPPLGRKSYRVPLITADGERRQLRMTTEPLELEPGRMGVMAVLRDETVERDLRAELSVKRRFHGMVGVSRAARDVYAAIERVSVSDYPVLVTGESGTGKELVAGAIHAESSRHAGAFVPVNCGAIPESIVESELFGHVRGAFTGAIRDKKGRFELADHGTLFLDEVGELPPSVQAKLLRVLETQRFTRVGDEREIQVDVRVVSATNRDLRAMVREGRFREDLFYRLCVVPLDLPPLRERREDIPLLIEHALERIVKETGRAGLRLGGPALDVLSAYYWPGNVRELINALQYASVRCTGTDIGTEHLPPEVRIGSPAMTAAETVTPISAPGRYKLTTEAVEWALKETGGNRAAAARRLGVGRATLYRFLTRYADGGSIK